MIEITLKDDMALPPAAKAAAIWAREPPGVRRMMALSCPGSPCPLSLPAAGAVLPGCLRPAFQSLQGPGCVSSHKGPPD